MDRRLRKIRLERRRGETLHQFARRLLVEAPSDVDALAIAAWYERFAEVRYGVPDDAAVRELAASLPLVKRAMRIGT
jgi:hypothetical protein